MPRVCRNEAAYNPATQLRPCQLSKVVSPAQRAGRRLRILAAMQEKQTVKGRLQMRCRGSCPRARQDRYRDRRTFGNTFIACLAKNSHRRRGLPRRAFRKYVYEPILAISASRRSRAFFGSVAVLTVSRLAGASPTTISPTMPIPI